MYSYTSFIALERMTDKQIDREIVEAKEKYDLCQKYYSELEKSKEKIILPKLDVLFKQLQNIESYIRKAENLKVEWDNNRYISKSRDIRAKFLLKTNIKLLRI